MQNIKTKRQASAKIGDVYKIKLDNNNHCYGQFIYTNKRGPVVQIFDIETIEELPIEKIINLDLMFSPVRFGIGYAIKNGFWEKVGSGNVDSLIVPKFRAGTKSVISKKVSEWFLVEGDNVTSLGPNLPEEYKSLERDMVWSAEDLVERIKLGGKIPYPAWDY